VLDASLQLEGEEEGFKIFKIQQMEVVFDLEPNRMIILRDVTEITQKEYTRSVTKLTEIMVASTSHDMRTPLNTMINMHKILEVRVRDDP